MPDEARQPSIVIIEMVPIHTKRLLWEMRERYDYLMMPFCLCRKAFYFIKIESFEKNQTLYFSGVYNKNFRMLVN